MASAGDSAGIDGEKLLEEKLTATGISYSKPLPQFLLNTVCLLQKLLPPVTKL